MRGRDLEEFARLELARAGREALRGELRPGLGLWRRRPPTVAKLVWRRPTASAPDWRWLFRAGKSLGESVGVQPGEDACAQAGGALPCQCVRQPSCLSTSSTRSRGLSPQVLLQAARLAAQLQEPTLVRARQLEHTVEDRRELLPLVARGRSAAFPLHGPSATVLSLAVPRPRPLAGAHRA